jgi:hypothetical protein
MATRKKESLRDAMDEALLDEQKKECHEWLTSKATQSPSKSGP